jgi:hypothetical protein
MRSQGGPQAGGRGVSINLVYLATNTQLVSGADDLAAAKAALVQ